MTLGTHRKDRTTKLLSYRLHTTELIAREGQDFEPPRTILIVQLRELDIVCFGQSSFGGHVYNAKNVALKLVHLQFVAVHITIYEVVECSLVWNVKTGKRLQQKLYMANMREGLNGTGVMETLFGRLQKTVHTS